MSVVGLGRTTFSYALQDHQVNALFVDNYPADKAETISTISKAENSSFIGAIALWHKDTKVQVSSDELGRITGI